MGFLLLFHREALRKKEKEQEKSSACKEGRSSMLQSTCVLSLFLFSAGAIEDAVMLLRRLCHRHTPPPAHCCCYCNYGWCCCTNMSHVVGALGLLYVHYMVILAGDLSPALLSPARAFLLSCIPTHTLLLFIQRPPIPPSSSVYSNPASEREKQWKELQELSNDGNK